MQSRAKFKRSWATELTFNPSGTHHTLAYRPFIGKPLVVLGGGPGLTPQLAARLTPFPCIAVNNSFMLMDYPALVVALDRRWWGWHGASVRARRCVGITTLRENAAPPGGFHGYAFKKCRSPALVRDPDTLCGVNSGQAALHMALHLGASRVFLAGFDLTFRGSRSHWHDGHAVPASLRNYETRFRPAIEEATALAKSLFGASVEAISPSAANIPHTDPEEAVEALRDAHENRVDYPEASAPL